MRINGNVKQIDCELGTNIYGKNGREIFEGDKVIFGEHNTEGVIVFGDAMFQIKYDDKFCILGKCKDFVAVEVVGHIEEDNYETH